MNKRYTYLILIAFIVAYSACAQKKVYTSPQGYDLNKPQKFFLPENLTEISGIAFHQGNPDSMYAIQDEEGKLFYFKPGVKSVTYSKYGKHGDYEDVAICNETVVILKSNGTLFSFPFSEVRDVEPDNIREWKQILPEGEYEGMYADNKTNQLYVLCKKCSIDKASSQITGYTFQLTNTDSVYQIGSFNIDVKNINVITGQDNKRIHPSALAKNTFTNEWYILSSVNKMLMITDTAWNIKAVHILDPKIFHHPEGIAFDSTNNLYISNEGEETLAGNVLKFTIVR